MANGSGVDVPYSGNPLSFGSSLAPYLGQQLDDSQALCFSGTTLRHCTSVVSSSGGCTCSVP